MVTSADLYYSLIHLVTKNIRGLLDLSFTLSRVFEALPDHVYVFFIVFLSREHLRLPNFVVSTFTSSKSLGF